MDVDRFHGVMDRSKMANSKSKGAIGPIREAKNWALVATGIEHGKMLKVTVFHSWKRFRGPPYK